jgi:uncharacterized membrane protein YgdD (TMEM256/DUF423 family)
MNAGLWIAAGAAFGFLGVLLGAFGAHALKARLDAPLLEVWQTAVAYQFHHALALLAVGLLLRAAPSPLLQAAGLCFAAGILLFSGSLYALCLSGLRVLGAITPLGGLLFLAGWACLFWAAWRRGSAAA